MNSKFNVSNFPFCFSNTSWFLFLWVVYCGSRRRIAARRRLIMARRRHKMAHRRFAAAHEKTAKTPFPSKKMQIHRFSQHLCEQSPGGFFLLVPNQAARYNTAFYRNEISGAE